MIRTLAVLILAFIAGPVAQAAEQAAVAAGRYLFVRAGDRAHKGNDFLAVIDADPSSASYGRLVATSAETPEDRPFLMKLDHVTGTLSVDTAFSDADGQPGFSFAECDWPHGWKGVGAPRGAVFSR